MSALKHSIQRAKERYELEFTAFDIGVLKALILSNRAVAMSRHNGRVIYMVRYNDVVIKLVFDERSGRIITILPNNGRLRRSNGKRGRKSIRKDANQSESHRQL